MTEVVNDINCKLNDTSNTDKDLATEVCKQMSDTSNTDKHTVTEALNNFDDIAVKSRCSNCPFDLDRQSYVDRVSANFKLDHDHSHRRTRSNHRDMSTQTDGSPHLRACPERCLDGACYPTDRMNVGKQIVYDQVPVYVITEHVTEMIHSSEHLEKTDDLLNSNVATSSCELEHPIDVQSGALGAQRARLHPAMHGGDDDRPHSVDNEQYALDAGSFEKDGDPERVAVTRAPITPREAAARSIDGCVGAQSQHLLAGLTPNQHLLAESARSTDTESIDKCSDVRTSFYGQINAAPQLGDAVARSHTGDDRDDHLDFDKHFEDSNGTDNVEYGKDNEETPNSNGAFPEVRQNPPQHLEGNGNDGVFRDCDRPGRAQQRLLIRRFLGGSLDRLHVHEDSEDDNRLDVDQYFDYSVNVSVDNDAWFQPSRPRRTVTTMHELRSRNHL